MSVALLSGCTNMTIKGFDSASTTTKSGTTITCANTAFPYARWGSGWGNQVNVDFDSDDYIYAHQTWQHVAYQISPKGRLLRQYGTYNVAGTGANQMNVANAVWVGPDNRIWVPEYNGARVHVWNKDGSSYLTFGAAGAGNGQFSNIGSVTFNPEGTEVYVGDGSGRMQVFDMNGVFQRLFGAGWSAWPNGPTFSADATEAFIFDRGANSVRVTDRSGTQTRTFGVSGTGAQQFNVPATGIIIPSVGLLIPDLFNNRIQIWDPATGTFIRQFSTPNWAWSIRYRPSNGLLYIGVQGQGIKIYDLDGNLKPAYVANGAGRDDFNGIGSVAVSPIDGKILVVDRNNNRIKLLDPCGYTLKVWGGGGSGAGQFSAMEGIFFSKDGKSFYVADSGNYRVQHFDLDGQYLGEFGSNGTGNGQFSTVKSGLVNRRGEIVLLDMNRHNIQTFTEAGVFKDIKFTLGAGATNDKFSSPRGIWQNPATGAYLVADSGNARVQVLDEDFNYVATIGSGLGSADGELNSPRYAVADSAGKIYVVENGNHRVSVFAADGTFERKFGSSAQGLGMGNFNAPEWVTFDAFGKLLVSETTANRLLLIDPADGAFLVGKE